MTATTARRVDYEDCQDELLAMRARDAASFSTLLGGNKEYEQRLRRVLRETSVFTLGLLL